MESSIFRDLDGIVDSILFPYHTLEEVLPPGCEAGPVWMEFACWVDSQKVDIRASESPLFLNICGNICIKYSVNTLSFSVIYSIPTCIICYW